MSIFCPECGAENEEGVFRCASCNTILDASYEEAQATRIRPTRWVVFGVVAGITGPLVTLTYLLGLSLVIAPREISIFNSVTERFEPALVVFSQGSLGLVLPPLMVFVLAGLVAGLTFRGRYLREVAMGTVVGVVVQALLWVISMGSQVGLIFTSNIHIVGESSQMSGRAFLLLPFLLVIFLFAALVSSVAVWVLVEQIAGKTLCLYCRKPVPIRPKAPSHCPSCDAPQERQGIQWPSVMVATGTTAVVFGLLLLYLGGPLGFYYHCDPYNLTDTCREVVDEAWNQPAWVAFQDVRDRDDAHLLIFHRWKYLGLMALLMVLAPLLVSRLTRRGSLPSAGVVIVLDWAVCSMVTLVVVAGSGGFESAYIWLIRFHAIALIAWVATGFIGAMIGTKLRYRSGNAYMQEIE
jgi:hypothetical protein